jgi:transposase
MVWKGLSTRWHDCPACGLSIHRDHNSARDILRLGQEQFSGVAAVDTRPGYGLQART